MSIDTSPDAEKVQIGILARMSPELRLKAAIDLSQTSRKLLEEGVRRRHPEYSENQVRFAVIRLLLPKALLHEAYPEAEDILP